MLREDTHGQRAQSGEEGGELSGGRGRGGGVLVGGVMERPSTLDNSRPPVSHRFPT